MIEKINGVTYQINNKNEAVVVSVENMENLLIPPYVNGCPVVSIEKRACENRTKLKYVKLPETVKVIKEQAFHMCMQLEEVRISTLTIELHEKAFADCGKLSYFYAYNIYLCGSHIFSRCKKLSEFMTDNFGTQSIFIGKIPAFSFLDCQNLKRLDFKEANIENSAFMGCSSLDTMKFWGETVLGPGVSKFVKKRKIFCTADSGLLDFVHEGTSVTII